MENNLLNRIGYLVLTDLIECYNLEEKYYMKRDLERSFMGSEEAELFLTNEEIIDYIKGRLSNNFYLQVTPVTRYWKSDNPENEDIPYEDILLEIKRNEDDD